MSILDTAKDIFGNIKETFSNVKLEDLKPKEPNLDDPLTKAFQDNKDYYDEMGANEPEAFARAAISSYLGIGDATDILNNQAIVNVDDDGGISVTDRYPNSAFGSAEVMYIPGLDSPVVYDPHRESFFTVRIKNKRQKGRHGNSDVYRDYISVDKINELTEMDLTESIAARERQMQDVLSNSFGYQAGEGVFYGELAFLSMLGPAVARGIYNLPTNSKRAANYIYKKYDEIVNKVKNNEIDPDVAKTQLNGLNDQAKVLVDEMGVTNKHQNQILQMISGKNVANISAKGDFTDVPDVRFANSAEDAAKIQRYNSSEFRDLVKKTYDEMTIRDPSGNIIATPSSRALSQKLGLGRSFDFGKYNIPEQIGIKFSPDNKTYTTYINAQNKAKETNLIVPAGKGDTMQLFFPNATKEIQLLKQLQTQVFSGTKGQSKVTQKDIVKNLFAGEAQKGEQTLRAYLKNTSLTDDMAKALNIDPKLVGTKLNEIDAFHYKLPENLPSQSVVDRNAAIKAWKETAPQWQLDLWNEAKKTISKYNKFFPEDARALDHIAPFINSVNKIKTQHPKNWQILTREDNNVLKKILFEGVDSKLGAMNTRLNNLKKGSEEYNALKKEMERVFQETIEELTDKSIFYNTTQRGIPKDFRATNIDKSTNPIDVLKTTLAEMGEQTAARVEGLKNINPKVEYNFKKGGKVRAFGSEGGDEEDLKRKPIFADYINAKIDTAQRDLKIEQMPESQRKQMAFFLEDPYGGQDSLELEKSSDASVRYRLKEKDESISSIQAKIAREMIDAKPTKFPLSSFPKLLTDNVLTKSMDRQMKTPFLILAAAANDIINKTGGDEKQFYERFPRLSEYLSSGYQPVPGTDQEAAYIDGIDEINRALESGVRNLSFNTMDLILGGIDLSGFGDGKLSERLRENYEKTAKNDPETFMGDMISLLVEFGVPGGLVTKLVTRLQKAMRLKGVNTMTRYIDDDVIGGARFAMQASNVAKRMGTGAVIFGAADVIGGGPYNTLTRMLPEDATLLPGKQIDTKNLSGKELAVANFKNRIRFGADGALIGGLFPLLGPPAWALTKGTASLPFKTIPGVNRSIFGGALQLAGVPLKIASDALAGKIPYTSKTIPLVGDAISYLGKKGATAAQATAAFIGKQVFTRATLGIYDLANARASVYTGIKPPTTMFAKNLPDFETWRRFSVNSADPLHQYLAKIDNKLALFRDIGKLGKDAFATKTQSDLYIRSKSRAVEKYLIDVERIAYKLAKSFEERYQKYGEFETIQKKYLDDVLDFLEGTIRLDQLPKQLQVPANDLRNYTNGLKKEFGELLPTTDPIKYLIDADINSMMRRSFAAFTNNSYAPTPRSVDQAKTFIKDLIKGNNGLRMEAEMAFPNKTIEEAIDEYASLKVADIMHTAKYEMADPFKALETITRKLGLDDIRLVTGDELPSAIKKLLGEEKNLRSSLLQTTGNIIASTSQKKALDQIADMGLSNGWLFRTKEEALGKGILNAAPLTDVKGSGFLLNDAIGLYGTPEIIKQLGGYSLFDGFLKSTIYQNILAAKAMVQGGKTLYSPATQMRNVGSAALFALNVGHIGGSASVPQAFKIVMDDIFGPGRNVDKKKLNQFIERKIELGVIDENVVSQELTAILNDLKGATKETGEPVISSFNQLIQRVGNTQLSQYVQRLYAGGDNLWKLYGHEFYISELKQFTKSIDDVKRYFNDIVGREFVEISPKTGVKKTVMEGIEEIAAHLVRDTYPTYSRVPPAIQAIRKLPIGNFISFPAEMLRTTATTLSTSLKHIASGNPGLQSMGYRSLFGQFTTLYGVNEGVKALGHAFTDVSPEAIRAYQDGLGPSFMQNHLMVPLTNKDPVTGEFKAFDLSSYNPYAYVIDPIEGYIRELTNTRMSVDEVEGEVYNRIFDASSPLMTLIEPFVAETIVLEPMFDIWARGGKSRNGATIYSPTDDFGDKVSKSFQHIISTIAPGFIRSTGQVLNALSLDTKQGRLSDLSDVLIRLLGGSIINVDPVSALDYKAIDIREIRSNAYKTEHFFSKENALERGPDVMAAEFQQIQNEALAAQFEVYKMFAQALDSGLLTRDQIEQVLGKDGRNVPNLDNLMDGVFTPVSYSESGLEQRADELYDEYKKSGILLNRGDLLPIEKLDDIIFEMEDIRFEDLVDPKRAPLPDAGGSAPSLFNIGDQQTEPVTPQLPNTPTPVVPNTNMNPVNPATGLTTTETALLSPGEQAIRQRQKGMA